MAVFSDIDKYEYYLDMRDKGLKPPIREGHKEYRRGELTEDLDTFLARVKGKPKAPRRGERSAKLLNKLSYCSPG